MFIKIISLDFDKVDSNNNNSYEELNKQNKSTLEWWEKRAHWIDRNKSPIIATARTKNILPDINEKKHNNDEYDSGNENSIHHLPKLPTEKSLNRRESIESSGRGSARSHSSSNFSTKSNFITKQHKRQKSETQPWRKNSNSNNLAFEINYNKKDEDWHQLHSNNSVEKHDNRYRQRSFSRYFIYF